MNTEKLGNDCRCCAKTIITLFLILYLVCSPLFTGVGEAAIVPVSTNGTMKLVPPSDETSYNTVTKEWTAPYDQITQVHFTGNTNYYRNYGYLYYWNGSSWSYLTNYRYDFDTWVNVPAGVNRIKLEYRNYGVNRGGWVDIPEVKCDTSIKIIMPTDGTMLINNPPTRYTYYNKYWTSDYPISRVRLKTTNASGDLYVYSKNASGSSRTIGSYYYAGTRDQWFDVPSNYNKSIQLRWYPYNTSNQSADIPEIECWVQLPDLVPPKPTIQSGGTNWNAKLVWTGSPGLSYELWRKTLNSSGSVVEDKCIYDGTATNYTTTDQASGEYYLYRIKYKRDSETSKFSSEVSFWTTTSPIVLSVGPGSVTLSIPKVMNGLTYKVLYRPEGTTDTSTMNTTSLTPTITGLDPTKIYEFGLAPVLTDGGKDWQADWATGIPLALQPGTPTFSDQTQTSFKASWPNNGNGTGAVYDVWWKQESPFKGDSSFSVLSGSHNGNTDESNGVITYLGGGWSASTHHNEAQITVGDEEGNKYLRFISDGSGAWAGATHNWSVEAGKWYRITVSVRTNSETPISINNYAIHTTDYKPLLKIEDLTSAEGWVTIQTVTQAPSNAGGSIYLYGNYGSAGTTIDYDNIIVEEFDSEPGPGEPSIEQNSSSTTATSATISNLAMGMRYDVMVEAHNVDGIPGDYVQADCRTIPAVPSALNGDSGALSWTNDAGRGWSTLNWESVPGAVGYKVWVFDGSAYRAFDVGNTTSWDSRAARIYPPESQLDGYSNNTQSSDLFYHNQKGLDLRDDPNKLYVKTTGTTYDNRHNYWFKISAYNESGDSGYSETTYMPTLPNRTDKTKPTGSVLINGDQMVTGSPSVMLNLTYSDPKVANYTSDTADDASGVVKMRISNNGSTWTNWLEAKESYAWTLDPEGFGEKNVYVQFRDEAGNISTSISDDIKYYLVDTQGPKVALRINSGTPVTHNREVGLEIKAEDDLSSADMMQMCFSNDYNKWTSWEDYSPYKTWELSSGDGDKKVYVKVKDASGNTGLGYASISLQTSNSGTPWDNPVVFGSNSGTKGTVMLNGVTYNANFVANSEVVLNLDAPGITTVQYSLDGMTWLPPESAAREKTISLPDWDGLKTVFVLLPNGSSYLSRFYLDKTPPSLEASWLGGATVTNNGSATLILGADDNISQQEQLQFKIPGHYNDWQPFASQVSLTFSGTGAQVVTVFVRDQAGNASSKTLTILN